MDDYCCLSHLFRIFGHPIEQRRRVVLIHVQALSAFQAFKNNMRHQKSLLKRIFSVSFLMSDNKQRQ